MSEERGAAKASGEVVTRLAAIIESSDDAIISKDLNGIITSWNRGAERIFGYTEAETIGQPVTMLIPVDRYNEEPGIIERVRRGERIDHYETVRRRKDGTLLDVSLSVSPILDTDGKVVGASKIARDISEAKLNRQITLRLYEIGKRCVRSGSDETEVLTEVLDTAIWITGADKGTIHVSDETSDILRLVVQRGFDAPFLQFFGSVDCGDPVDCSFALAAAETVVVEDVATSVLFAGQPSLKVLLDAGVRAVQSTPLIGGAGTILGVMSTHFDRPHRLGERECQLLDVLARLAADYIERKRSEEQRDQLLQIAESAREEAVTANRAKDEFLAMLGHELRNPLASVRNAIAAAMLDEPSRGRALQIARRQTDQLGRLVDDILDVARITHGRVQLRKEQISLADIVQRAMDAVRGLMDDRSHTLTFSAPPQAIHIEGDASRLEQALVNLLTNAAKYTDAGGIVTITAEQHDRNAVIRVADNGLGIAPDVLSQVFEPFTQGSRSLERAEGGLGLGLTLVRRIVELHGGSVEVNSAGVGCGTEFAIRLPAPPGLGEPATKRPEQRQRRRKGSSTRVLMVEDNLDAAESLLMILELLGHHVRVVHDGSAALEAARANLPDIMLIDIGLPGMNGYEVAQAIRQDPVLKHLVLVALTGYGRPEDKARAVAAGYDYHLVKPVNLEALGDLVARVGPQAEANDYNPIH